MTSPDRSGPDAEAVHRYIVETFPDTDVAAVDGGTFFSCDPERHWPNFATLVTSDAFDDASDLSREGVYRLNIGVSRRTFDRLLGPIGDDASVDATVLDRVIPHPVYAKQHWISILNPSAATFDEMVRPLLDEAHERAAWQLTRRRGAGSPGASSR
jgi:hypothetical protein